MGTPFKMKGSPMQRNFGVSPAKHTMSGSSRVSPEQAAKHNKAPASSYHSGSPHGGEDSSKKEVSTKG
jgi:hypothetical protein